MSSSRGRPADRSSTDPSTPAVEEPGGLLLWITPTGARREVVQSSLAETTNGSASCDRCGSSTWLETVVREHRRCGYVAFDGMVHPDGQRHACPKCETTDSVGFQAVATVWTCRTCGHPIDEAD